jgi:glucose-1-phosphate thymidylyltransferase
MINNGKLFKTATVDEWLDCGTLTAWLETTGVILEKENHSFDTTKFSNSHIIPPVFIGDDVIIENSTIGPKVSIENGSTIKSSTIKNTIIRESALITNTDLEDSTIGAFSTVHNASGNIDLGDHSSIIVKDSNTP